jgi:hypothetical protein
MFEESCHLTDMTQNKLLQGLNMKLEDVILFMMVDQLAPKGNV